MKSSGLGSAVSTPIFASRYSFFSVFQDLQEFLCTIPDFSDFSEFLDDFLQNLASFRKFLRQNADLSDFLEIFTDFFRNFAEFLRF